MSEEVIIVPDSGGEVIISRYSTDALVDAFLLDLDASGTTKATYGKALRLFMDWVGESGRELGFLAPSDILAYKTELLDVKKKKAMTVNLYLAAVRRFYKWTALRSIYPDIAKDVGSVKTKRDTFRKMHLESSEGAKLLEHEAEAKKVVANSEGLTRTMNANEEMIARRNYAMVNLMLRTGLRTIEVSRLDIGDIARRKERRILWVWGKGHAEKDDFVVLTDEAYQPIADYLKFRHGAGEDEPLFACEGLGSKGRRMSTRRIQDICKEGLRAIGLDGHEYSAHSLRHTTGTEILNNGGSMFDVQRVLRHTTPATSQLYVNTIIENRRLEDASEELLDSSFKSSR